MDSKKRKIPDSASSEEKKSSKKSKTSSEAESSKKSFIMKFFKKPLFVKDASPSNEVKKSVEVKIVEENDENIVKNVETKKNEGDIVAETLKEMVGKIEKNASQSIETQSIQKKTPKTKPKKKKEKVELPPPQTKNLASRQESEKEGIEISSSLRCVQDCKDACGVLLVGR